MSEPSPFFVFLNVHTYTFAILLLPANPSQPISSASRKKALLNTNSPSMRLDVNFTLGRITHATSANSVYRHASSLRFPYSSTRNVGSRYWICRKRRISAKEKKQESKQFNMRRGCTSVRIFHLGSYGREVAPQGPDHDF